VRLLRRLRAPEKRRIRAYEEETRRIESILALELRVALSGQGKKRTPLCAHWKEKGGKKKKQAMILSTGKIPRVQRKEAILAIETVVRDSPQKNERSAAIRSKLER